ncbi:MAG: Rrf2 family transcriptional regulator [Gammaproteobacteria bacterium]
MQLTLYTDYSLRVLIYLGLKGDELTKITELAENYGISRNHLVKVVHNLGTKEFIHTTRGKGGGVRLARRPEQINIGEVVRHTEMNFNIVECFGNKGPGCPITPVCALKGVLGDAFRSFMNVLDQYTLADVLKNDRQLAQTLHLLKPITTIS